LVLDTNVCLDLLVFGDPRCARLREALARGEATAVSDAACRAEWRRVLAYPQLGLEPARQAELLARYDGLVAVLDGPRPEAAGLPRCEDADDQKFLELAHAASAQALLSRDKALLKLARRAGRLGLFRILAPEAWDVALA
jgi:predicted nucleic acid-binding protein